MIIQGFKLALLGMTVVFVFLVLLVTIVIFSSWLLKPYTKREENALAGSGRGPKESDEQRITAVITAAVAAHRVRLNKRTC